MLIAKATKHWRKGLEDFEKYLACQMTENVHKLYTELTEKLICSKDNQNKDDLKEMQEVVEAKIQKWNMKELSKVKEHLTEVLSLVDAGLENGFLGFDNYNSAEKRCMKAWKCLMQYNESVDAKKRLDYVNQDIVAD